MADSAGFVSLIGFLMTLTGFYLGSLHYFVTYDLVDLLKMLGPLISIVGYVTPLQAVRSALVTKNSSDLPLPVLMSQLGLCTVSVAYGITIRNLPVIVTNSIGAVFQLTWLSAWYFIQWSVKRQTSFHPCYFVFLSFSVVFGLVQILSYSPLNLIALTSMIFSFILSLSPLSQLPKIMKSKDCSSIPLPMAVMMFLGNSIWGVYGWILGLNVILVPCLLGFEVSLLLILVNLWTIGTPGVNMEFLQRWFKSREEQEEEIVAVLRQEQREDVKTVTQTVSE
jgi:uncharacterized protein with PQ loop repeat